MANSIWAAHTQLPTFPPLKGDTETDVLIIGGGLCGLLCAYFLKQSGINYTLVEGNSIGCGITKNTTAKITSQHGLFYSRFIKTAGREKTQMYLQANESALAKYKELAKTINCDFELKNAYTYSLSSRQKLEDEVEAVNTIGFAAQFVEDLPLPFETKGAVLFPSQAQFDPLKFIAQIAKNLNIYEHTMIRDIAMHTAWTDSGKIIFKKAVIATHFPFINKHGSYFLKMYQQRSYVIALKNASNVNGMYIDEASNGLSFRNAQDLLLIGGGGHRTGKQGGNWQVLREFAKKYYPHSQEQYFWATQDCMSLDHVPYIGPYSKNTPDLFTASGFNKWGMTSSMVSAMLLRDMLLEKKNDWASLFSPSRNILKPQLFVNTFEATVNLLTPSRKRCPHLGCALKWNPWEHTWDCPCHGSRFERNGTIIDNPATEDANIE